MASEDARPRGSEKRPGTGVRGQVCRGVRACQDVPRLSEEEGQVDGGLWG